MLKPNGEEVVKKENYRYTKSFTKQNFPCHVVPTRPPSPASYYTAGCSGDIAVVLYQFVQSLVHIPGVIPAGSVFAMHDGMADVWLAESSVMYEKQCFLV